MAVRGDNLVMNMKLSAHPLNGIIALEFLQCQACVWVGLSFHPFFFCEGINTVGLFTLIFSINNCHLHL